MTINNEKIVAELTTAGVLGLPFSWGDDGSLTFPDDLPVDQIATIEAVFAAHDPYDPNAAIKAQIAALEAQQTDRRVREAALGIDAGWLSNLNSQIAELRAQLV